MKTETGRPAASEYHPLHAGYVALVPEGDILESLERQRRDFLDLLHSVPKEREGLRYAPGKWSIRELAGHVIDSEKVFGYRAMCIARGEEKSLPGFDENLYGRNSPADSFPLAELAEEFDHLRAANILFFRHLNPEAWKRTGTANENTVSVRAMAYVIAGHAVHHAKILRERYLS